MSKKETIKNLSAEEFVKIWQWSDSAQYAAKWIGCSDSYVYDRASKLRDAGVKLKYFNDVAPESVRAGKGAKVDGESVEFLNFLIPIIENEKPSGSAVGRSRPK